MPESDVRVAVLRVLTEAGEQLHWTVIQDRALRSGAIDPFDVRDVRGAVLAALASLVAEGAVVKGPKGVYFFAD